MYIQMVINTQRFLIPILWLREAASGATLVL